MGHVPIPPIFVNCPPPPIFILFLLHCCVAWEDISVQGDSEAQTEMWCSHQVQSTRQVSAIVYVSCVCSWGREHLLGVGNGIIQFMCHGYGHQSLFLSSVIVSLCWLSDEGSYQSFGLAQLLSATNLTGADRPITPLLQKFSCISWWHHAKCLWQRNNNVF